MVGGNSYGMLRTRPLTQSSYRCVEWLAYVCDPRSSSKDVKLDVIETKLCSFVVLSMIGGQIGCKKTNEFCILKFGAILPFECVTRRRDFDSFDPTRP